MVNGSGQLERIGAAHPLNIELVHAKAECKAAAEPAALYQIYAAAGVTYGPTYRTLRKGWVSGAVGVACLRTASLRRLAQLSAPQCYRIDEFHLSGGAW